MTQGPDNRPFRPDITSSSSAGSPSGIPSGERVLQPGERLGGFQIQDLIGAGGMAVVYKALQLSLNRPVALKVLNSRFSRDPAFIQRFEQEAGALAALNHPNIVNIIDKGRAEDLYFFVMEYVPGTSLDKAIIEGHLTLTDYIIIILGIRDALAYVHSRGIVHRDIKPANILLSDEGRVKVSDFGIAHIAWGDPKLQKSGKSQFGTSYYMAPEQAEQGKPLDARADIYALGVTFYKMLTRELPQGAFAGPSQLNPLLPQDIDPVLLKALQSNLTQRYQSVEEFCNDLLSVLWEHSGLARTDGQFPVTSVAPDLVSRPSTLRPTPMPIPGQGMPARPTATFPALPQPAPPVPPRPRPSAAPAPTAPSVAVPPPPGDAALQKPREARKEKTPEALLEESLGGAHKRGFNKTLVIAALVLVVVAGAGAGGYFWYLRARSESAPSLADLGEGSKPTLSPPTAPEPGGNPFEKTSGVSAPVPAPSAPGPSPTPAGPEPPVEQVLITIPAGAARIGDLGSRWASPPRVVQLPAFKIERYEVTNWMYAQFIKATGHPAPPYWRNGAYADGLDNYPVVEVSLKDARAYAQWAGRDLPTEEQWERSARGMNGWNYPWGQEWKDGATNLLTGRLLPVTAPGWMDITWEAEGEGCHFMAGNALEWTTSWFSAYPGCLYRSPYFDTAATVIRGGAFVFRTRDPLNPAFLARASARCHVPGPEVRMDNLGFRCVVNAL